MKGGEDDVWTGSGVATNEKEGIAGNDQEQTIENMVKLGW